ncbi:phage shock protein PspC (stress-responsive transcriptional regulator) [Peribacillus deserti]|uniref:Phage shock protein PspC (Stress-responsive transcriptional regulator) n=1 Tax=Peribacillus deserti TaxID=673318 RepID=A0ABS2QCT8_9BACI|nr:PspC domain-containing protein [Peribacillus deserti]MBM7690954.1 phage shock protein PspC (stress-responsive transcriptional regulator) [Peribacillus deserti]
MSKKLTRSRTNRKVGGILGGAAQYLGVNSTLLRLIFFIALICTGFSLAFVYFILMFILPNEGDQH